LKGAKGVAMKPDELIMDNLRRNTTSRSYARDANTKSEMKLTDYHIIGFGEKIPGIIGRANSVPHRKSQI